MAMLEELLNSYGFRKPQPVQGRASVADLFSRKRCGIYLLHFADGQAYVGQTTDIVRRYAAHRRTHPDIVAISFRPLQLQHLDEWEVALIKALEQSGQVLRNVVFSALPPVESDFDLIMPRDEQELWLSGRGDRDQGSLRPVNVDLRRKHAAKFDRLRKQRGIDIVLNQVRRYVRIGLPAARRGELSFWSISCLPAYRNTAITVFMRVNINWQEVFTVYREKQSGQTFFSLHTARTPIDGDPELLSRFPDMEVYDEHYVPGGHDQVNLVVPGSIFNKFIRRPSVKTAIRQLNLRLMRKGPCNFARHHCFDLADAVLPD
jgi:hypothetical protein